MVERQHRSGNLVFDRDAIVRAALRACVETNLALLDPLERHRFLSSSANLWVGDLQRGAFNNDNCCGDYEVMAWTEEGVVGLAYELGWGPIEQFELSVDGVTGGPDDVRGAVPGLPGQLEPALELATSLLVVGWHGQREAGMGFWLHGDRVEGTLFEDPQGPGAKRLAAWGLLRGDRLAMWWNRDRLKTAAELEKTVAAPIHAIIDAVTARRLSGPTELTPDELATLCPTPPNPKQLLYTQRNLQKAGITWPGSPEIPPE